jgi:DNA polymerase III gamma/tau subunit
MLDFYYDISQKENINLSLEQIKLIMLSTQKSIRKTINIIDKFRILNDKFTDEQIKEIVFDISYINFENIIAQLNDNKISSAINILFNILDSGYSSIDIYEYFYFYIKSSEQIPEYTKLKLVPIICKFISIYYVNFENKLDLIFFTNSLFKCMRQK